MEHCPTCGQEITNPYLDEDGYPQVGQTWVIPKHEIPNKSGGFPTLFPEISLRINEIVKGDGRGREIRGWHISYRNGIVERPFATDLETFDKVWGKEGYVQQGQGTEGAKASPYDTRELKEVVEDKMAQAQARIPSEVDGSRSNNQSRA